jgi:hypothetical protein
MAAAEADDSVHWVRTVGAPHPDDPRDGELHQLFGRLPDSFDLEPWDDELGGLDAHYVRDPHAAPVEEDGRLIWQYNYSPP